jgi:hypothetical protein
MDPELAEMLTQTITVEPFASEDARGKPSYGAPTSYRCRRVDRTTVVRTTDGREIVSRGFLIVAPPATIGEKDRLTLDNGRVVPILAVGDPRDPETGEVDHFKVYFGNSSFTG